MSEFNFQSSICTSKEQSEHLLALGLRKETADCYWFYCDIAKEWKCTILSSTQVFKDYPTTVIPAWSLGRLVEDLIPQTVTYRLNDYHFSLNLGDGMIGYFPPRLSARIRVLEYFYGNDTILDDCIDCIEWLIKEGYFNKEYLV